MYIQQDELKDGQIEQLIKAHLEEMKKHSPPESIHALPLDDLKKQDVTVWRSASWLRSHQVNMVNSNR